MCKECKETIDRMGDVFDEVKELLRDQHIENEKHHDEMFTRLRGLEVKIAKAEGAKAGVIFAFSLIWAVILTAAAGLWKWFYHS